MSWKMFWQIVLLIVIASVVTSLVKVGSHKMCWSKRNPAQMQMMEKHQK